MLQSITYENISDDPSPLTRTIDFVVNDGQDDSNLLSRDVQIIAVNDPPVLSNIETTVVQYTENDLAAGITSSLSIDDPDDTEIENATVTISGNPAPGEDVLSFTALIRVFLDTRLLSMSPSLTTKSMVRVSVDGLSLMFS